MKAVILAAGKGTRLRPITEEVPKPLIEINEKPFLYHLLRSLEKAGITDIALVVGYKSHMIDEYLKSMGINATLIEQKEPLGTGHAVKMARKFAGNDNFIVVNGDNLYSPEDISSMAIEDNFCYIGSIEHSHPEKYGVLITEDGFLQRIIEKPANFVGNKISTGLYKFTPCIFEALEKIGKSPRGEYEITDAVTILAGKKLVKPVALKNYWLDLGCINDIEKINAFMKTV